MNSITELIVAGMARGTWLMLASLLVAFLLARRAPLAASAFLRGAIAGLFILPVLAITLPAVRVPVLSAVSTPSELAVPSRSPIQGSQGGAVSQPIVPSDTIMGTDAPVVERVPNDQGSGHVAAVKPVPTGDSQTRVTGTNSWRLLLLGVYFAGCLYFAVRMVIGLCGVRRLRSSVQVTDAGWRGALQECRRRLGVSAHVEVVTSGDVSVPMTVGWRRPMILLPESALGSSPIDREAILMHELAHIRRRDYFWLLLLRVVQVGYWCHPLMWLIAKVDRQLREQACDDVCIHWVGSGERYCDALLTIANRMTTQTRFAVGLAMAGASKLSRRVAHILQSAGSDRCVPGCWARLTVAGSLLVAAPVMALVQFVPRTSLAVADDGPADDTAQSSDPTSPAADAVDQGATTATFWVTDADGANVPTGEAHVRGYARSGEFFEYRLDIIDGSVEVSLPSSHLESLIVEIGAPGCLTYYKQFSRAADEAAYIAQPIYEFPLRRGQHIGGRLVNETGEPVVGATIYLYAPTGGEIEQGFDGFELRVTSDDDGRWETTRATADLTNLHIGITHDHYVARGDAALVASDDHEQLRNLSDVRTLEAAPTLSGTVVAPDGSPVEGAIMLINSSHWSDLERDGQIPVTDANGEFAFSNVRLGEHELTVFSPDWALQTVSVKIPATEPLRITMQKGSRVEFRAVDNEGQPIEGIRFIPGGDSYFDYFMVGGKLSIITNADGFAVWENAPAEALSYQTFGFGYMALPGVEYGPAGSPHTVVFDRTIPVELTVFDAATGEELTEFKLYEGVHFKANTLIHWFWSFQRPLPPPVEGETPTGRTLELANLDRLVQYRIQADGYLPAVSPVLDAATIVDRPVQVEIRMEPYTEYSGRVLRPDGTPAAAADVHLFFARDGESASVEISNGVPSAELASQVQCDAEGRFEIDQQADPFICMILDEAGYLEITDVELFATESVTLHPWSQVQGEVRLSGEPAPGLQVRVQAHPRVVLGDGIFPDIHYISHGTVDASGEYLFPRCIAGRQSLWVHYDADAPAQYPSNREARGLDLATGETSIQDFGRDTVDIVGRILIDDPSANDWSRSLVQMEATSDMTDASTSEHGLLIARPDESGAFRIRNVRPGAGVVYVYIWMKDDPYQSEGFEAPITPEMFEGKSATDPVDLGDITPFAGDE